MEIKKFTEDFQRLSNIAILNGLGFFFLDFLIPYVATVELDATGSEMGIIFSVRTIGYLALAPIVGSLADKYSPKLLVIVGSVGRGVSYFLLYSSIVNQQLILMIAGNLLLGAGAGFFWIPFDMLISNKSHPDHRSEAFGVRTAALGKGTLFGAVIGFTAFGYFAGVYPSNRLLLYSPLFIYGVGNLVAAYLFIDIDEQLVLGEVIEDPAKITYGEFFTSMEKPFKIAMVFVLFTLFLSSTNGSIAKPFILVFLTKNIESDPVLASAAYIPAGISSLLVAPRLGKIVDRYNYKLSLSIGIFTGALVTFFLINTTSLAMFSILLILDSTIATGTGLVLLNIMSRISIDNRGKVFGLQTIFTDIGAIFGPIVGGIIWDDYGDKAPFYLSIGIEILLIPVILYAIARITPFLSEITTENSGDEI